MKKFIAVLTALFLTFNTAAFGMEADIVDIAVSTEGFSVLVAAVTEAELVDTLKSDGPFTVFAPTDDAFTNLLEALEISAEDLLAHPQLVEVLLYYVVPGKVISTDLSDGMIAKTALGESIKVDLSDGVKINTSTVVAADIEASNGVIHVIDEVLVPESFKLMADDMMKEDTMEDEMMEETPSIVDIALSDEQFSMLVMLLQKADLVEALQGDGPFTVFAPTNEAFVELVTALGITPEELMAQPALADVLLYHVISGKVMSTDLSDGLMAPTLNGDTIKFDLSDGVKADSSSVIAADIMASNGVIHVVDSVLVPNGFVLEEVIMDEESVPQAGESRTPWFLGFGLAGAVLFLVGRRFR
jgi:transforming growth factor-beta-induced protein